MLVHGIWHQTLRMKITLPVLPILDAVILKALQKTKTKTKPKKTNKQTKKHQKYKKPNQTKNSVLRADGPLK